MLLQLALIAMAIVLRLSSSDIKWWSINQLNHHLQADLACLGKWYKHLTLVLRQPPQIALTLVLSDTDRYQPQLLSSTGSTI